MDQKKLAFVLLIIIVALAFGLRIAHLGQESLWTDEAVSLRIAQSDSVGDVVSEVTRTEGAPPAYYLLLHYWIRVFDDSEVSIRFLSVLFSVLSVVLMYDVARRYVSVKAALCAALFMAVSMIEVVYAQEARLYSMYTFLVLLTMYCFERGFVANEQKYRIGYVIALLLALYTNYLAVVLVFFAGFMLLWKQRGVRSWITHTSAAVVLSVPLLWLAFDQFVKINNGLAEVLTNFGLPSAIAQVGLFIFALPSAIICGILVLLIAFRKRIESFVRSHALSPFTFALLLSGASVLFLYISMYPLRILGVPIIRVPITHPYFLIRHSLFLTPLVYLYLGWKVASLKKYAVLALAIILITQTAALGMYYTEVTKSDWKSAAQFIEDGDLVFLDRSSGGSNTYLLQRYEPHAKLVGLSQYSSRSEFVQMPDEIVLQIARDQSSFWLVITKDYGAGDYFKDLFDKNFVLIEQKNFYDIKVYHYELKK